MKFLFAEQVCWEGNHDEDRVASHSRDRPDREPLFLVETAEAQATRSWVSGVGDDVNNCSRTAPCKTFAGAISEAGRRGHHQLPRFQRLRRGDDYQVDHHRLQEVFGGIVAATTNGVNVNDDGVVVTLRTCRSTVSGRA